MSGEFHKQMPGLDPSRWTKVRRKAPWAERLIRAGARLGAGLGISNKVRRTVIPAHRGSRPDAAADSSARLGRIGTYSETVGSAFH